MRMSTKGRFAVNAMIDLALRSPGGPVALAGIAARQQVSLSYLEQLFSRLRKSGLVHSTRGPGGGYTLGRAPTEISVADIVLAVEDLEGGPVAPEEQRSPHLTGSLWSDVQDVMLRHLATVTLLSLVDEQRARGYVDERRPGRPVAPAPLQQRTVRTTAPNSVFAFGQSFGG